MSARNDLLSALTAALPTAQFRVSDATDTPDIIDTGVLALRAFTKTVVPGPTLGLLTYALDLWMLTGKADPTAADPALDAGLDTMIETLLTMQNVQFVNATRGVMDNVWHGYLFTLNLFAQTGA